MVVSLHHRRFLFHNSAHRCALGNPNHGNFNIEYSDNHFVRFVRNAKAITKLNLIERKVRA